MAKKTVQSEDLNNFKLDSMSKRIRCVIDTNKDEKGNDLGFGYDIKDIYDELCKDGYLFAYIFHDKDQDKDGVLKRRHLHLVLECPTRRRVSYYIKHFSEMFGVERSQVQVQVSNNFDWDIQYLLHKNNPEKTSYDIGDITTNMPLHELQERLFTVVHNTITNKGILDVVRSCRTKSMVILKLGETAQFKNYAIDAFIKDGWLGYDLMSKDRQQWIREQNNVSEDEL